jgi:uncharacterized peroxidase-related enzyme
MRLAEAERGDSLFRRLLIRFISTVSGMRLPDAARVAWYRSEFFGKPMGDWTHAAMRGASEWTVGERELMAAHVAKWNACPFCIGAHSAISSIETGRTIMESALQDFRTAELPERLRATLVFLEKLTLQPDKLTADDARLVLHSGVSTQSLTDAIAVASLFNVTTRYANALDFAMPTQDEFGKAAKMLLKRGYKS